MSMSVGEAVKISELLTTAALLSSKGSQLVDRLGFQSAKIGHGAVVVSGTNPTLDGRLQEAGDPVRASEVNTIGGDIDNWVPLRVAAADNVSLCYGPFTKSGVQQVMRGGLRLRRFGAPNGYVFIGIWPNSGGNPGPAALATSERINASAITDADDGENVVFDFASPPDLADASLYHVVLSGSYTPDANINVRWATETVVGTGLLRIYDAAWAADTNQQPLVYLDNLEFSDVDFSDDPSVSHDYVDLTQINNNNTPAFEEKSVDLKTLKRYLRLDYTIGGTVTPTFAVGAQIVLGEAQDIPVS